MRDTGIVIVTYNSGAEIGECLDAALAACDSVIVIDNASEDDTTDVVRSRNVRLIANSMNRGFAAAVNQGVHAIEKDFILLLNPDAVLKTGIGPLRSVLDQPNAAGSCGKLIGVDGRTQAGFAVRRLPTPAALAFEALLVNRLWRTNPVNWHYRCLDVNLDLPGWVEQPAGALFMFRRDVWSRLGGFDESFFPLWFEDVDFCQRAANLGYRMYYTPSVVARHTGGHSIQRVSLEKREICWYGNLLGYAYKHFPLAGARVVSLTVFAGSILRMIMGIVIQRSLKPITVYGAVMRLAGRRMLAGPSR